MLASHNQTVTTLLRDHSSLTIFLACEDIEYLPCGFGDICPHTLCDACMGTLPSCTATHAHTGRILSRVCVQHARYLVPVVDPTTTCAAKKTSGVLRVCHVIRNLISTLKFSRQIQHTCRPQQNAVEKYRLYVTCNYCCGAQLARLYTQIHCGNSVWCFQKAFCPVRFYAVGM